MKSAAKLHFSLGKFEWLIFLIFLLFSWFLAWKAFRINPQGNLEIATKAWSDFSATIPLIRSFSLGANFPPQYPLFAGPPIRYHFFFFLLVGLLEKTGLPLDWALNTLSAVSFFALLVFIYILGRQVFKKKSVGLIAVLLFLFNGSFSFIEFFKKHPPSLDTATNIIQNDTFASFGPYDGKIVSAFWNLNIFTNQRHLALAYATFIFLVLIIYKASKSPKKLTFSKSLLLGLFVGLLPFIHLAVFGMVGIALLTFFILYPKLRRKIFTIGAIALILSLPQILYMGASQVRAPFFNPGYLVKNLTVLNFLKYWFLNLGLTSILAPIGFISANKTQRKIFLPFFALFVVGNLFQFSSEIAANHKFFNLFLIGANLFVSFLLVTLWKRKLIGKFLVPIMLIFLTFSGIIDIFPIVNDRHIEVKDYPNDPTVSFIVENTSKSSVFLNSSFLYDPASLAGRKIYLGWPYFAWSAGYDTHTRYARMRALLSAKDKKLLCSSLTKAKIDYIEIQNPTPLEDISINYSFFEANFRKIYQAPGQNLVLYEVAGSCRGFFLTVR